jgi:DHA2 family multidrug resistance protein-like MFS transporter
MTPFPLGSALIALVAGHLSDRFHAGILGSLGLALFATAMALLALLPPHPTTIDVVWRTALGGLGFGLFVTPNLRAMVGATPRHRSGAITGLTTSTRMIGSTTGVALAALVFSAAGSPGADIRTIMWLSVVLAIVALAISSLRIDSVGAGGAGPQT